MITPVESDMEQQQQEQAASDTSTKQVVRYKAFHQLRNYVENSLGLRRVLIQNLPDQASLDGCYVGGRIVNVVSSAGGSHAGSIVFVEDDGYLGMERLHGTLVISQELMDQLPPALDHQFMLFVGGASLEETEEDTFFLHTGKNVIVEGAGVTLLVVHPRIDDPKLYQKPSFRPDWWTRAKGKRKRKRKKMAEQSKAQEQGKRERLATSVTGGEEGGEPLTRPGLSTIGDVNHGREKREEELSCKPGPSSVDGIGEGEGRSSINLQSSEVTSIKDGISYAGEDKSSSPSDPGWSAAVAISELTLT